MKVKRGDKFLYTLPSWIDNGREVVVVAVTVLTPFGRNSFNGHDIIGTWVNSKGKTHRGKFYLHKLVPLEEEK